MSAQSPSRYLIPRTAQALATSGMLPSGAAGRADLMRSWSDQGIFNFEDVPKDKRAELAGRVYDCVALRLADAIAWATR